MKNYISKLSALALLGSLSLNAAQMQYQAPMQQASIPAVDQSGQQVDDRLGTVVAMQNEILIKLNQMAEPVNRMAGQVNQITAWIEQEKATRETMKSALSQGGDVMAALGIKAPLAR